MESSKMGCLILHGFNGSRKEVASLSKRLRDFGYNVAVPVLSGHEAGKKELEKSKYSDWIKSADDAIKVLQQSCEKIVIIGFSMGGLIAANLYQKHKVESIVFINTPIYYLNIGQKIRNLLTDFSFHINRYVNASKGSTIKACIEFMQLVTKTKPLFADIQCNSLICQTLDDDTVNPKSAGYIYSKLAGKKILKKHKTGGHMVFSTDAGDEIGENICVFLNEMLIKEKESIAKTSLIPRLVTNVNVTS